MIKTGKIVRHAVSAVVILLLGTIAAAIVAVLCILFIPAVQGWLAHETAGYLSDKLKTEVRIDQFRLKSLHRIELGGVFVADQKKDTLLYCSTLYGSVKLNSVLKSTIVIDSISVDTLTAKVYNSTTDSLFSYQFIIDAFAGGPKKEVNSKPSAFQLASGAVTLRKIRLLYNDAFHRNRYLLSFGSLRLDNGSISIPNGSYATGTISLTDLYADGKMGKDSVQCRFSRFGLGPSTFNLKEQKVNVGTVLLDSLALAYITASKPAPEKKKAPGKVAKPWSVAVESIGISGSGIRYDNNLTKKLRKGFDANHILIGGLNLNAQDIVYTPDIWNIQLEKFCLKEQSGLELKQMYADVSLKNRQLSIDRIRVQTGHTLLRMHATLKHFDPDRLAKESKKITLDAKVDTLKLGYADLMTFSPSVARSVPKEIAQKSMMINSHLSGTLGNIRIDHFRARTGDNTSVGVSASITGLPDMKHLRYNVRELTLATSRKDLTLFGRKLTMLDSLNLPDKLNISLKGTGSTSGFNGNILLATPDGNVSVSSDIKNVSSPKNATYNATIESSGLNIGKILRQDSTIRMVAFSGTVTGKGLTLKDADASFDINIPYIDLLHYRYKSISLSGTIKESKVDYKAAVLDTNLTVRLLGNALINGVQSKVESKIGLEQINLQPLGFTSTPVSLISGITVKFDNFDVDSLNASVNTDSLIVINNRKATRVKQFLFRSIAKPGDRTVQLRNDLFDAILTGRYKLSKIPQSFTYILSDYFPHLIAKPTDSLVSQKFYFLAATLSTENFSRIFPAIKYFDGSYIRADFNTADKSIKVFSEFPRITTDDFDVTQAAISSDLKDGNGSIKVNAVNVKAENINIYSPDITFSKKDEYVAIGVTTKDSLNVGTLYNLESQLSVDKEKLIANILPTCILNGDEWNINPKNRFEFNSKGFFIKDFELGHGKQLLKINTTGDKPKDPVRFDFVDFRIKSITNIAGLDTNFLRGKINGNFTLERLSPDLALSSDMTIDDLTFRRNLLGNLALKVINADRNVLGATLSLHGNGNDVDVQADYWMNKPNRIEGTLNIAGLNAKLLEPLSNGQLTKTSGSVNGNISVGGTVSSPKISGDLNMENATLMVAATNSYLKFKKEKIVFDDQGIGFNNFTLLDSSGNKFVVNGNILTTDYNSFRFNLKFTSRGFEILRAKENNNSIAYGPVWIDADARITGDANLPRITATTTILPYSKLNIILPETGSSTSSKTGIVEFSDSLSINKPVMLTFTEGDTVKPASLKSIDLNANISIDKEAELLLKLSPSSGDMLDVKGDARINATIDPSGKFSMSGKYEIKKGTYDLNFGGLMERKFEITDGSTITWRGTPTDADVNITAAYNVKAAPIDLMADRAADMDPTQLAAYKQKQEFIVYLSLKGDMMKPEISFSVDMPESSKNVLDGNVYALVKELNQTETEQKKQVASLLVLGRFVANSPFSSLAGGSTQSALRESASRILSDQINALADNLIQGVNLDFNLESKEVFDSGESKNQTNLNIGISKNIGNRVSVYVGSNFALENANPNEQKANIAGDVAVEYKLTKDGRYRIKIFRKNTYEAVIAGEVVETGLTFSLVVDYNRIKEIFMKPKRIKL